MTVKNLSVDYQAVRKAIGSLPSDVSNDAIGAAAPRTEDLYAPEPHAAALDPTAPIVQGARGTGKSFWAGVLGNAELRALASRAYPKLRLARLDVQFGYTGIEGPAGIGRDKLEDCVPPAADERETRAFWWATILRGVAASDGSAPPPLKQVLTSAHQIELREKMLTDAEQRLQKQDRILLVVYDALDTVAASWPRRRLLTQALLEVVWAMRAYRSIRLKLFLRPDQMGDDALRFVELPKLRTGAVRLTWTKTDLYGLLWARLALGDAHKSFGRIVEPLGIDLMSRDDILTRAWSPTHDESVQKRLMIQLAGPFMGEGTYAYKKGNTYDWPIDHLGDAANEVTPRSFLGLMIAAANYGVAPPDRAITPGGIQHGLRAASKTRVDQLHQEFLWIKGVLAPLAGILLPQDEKKVFAVWKRAKTIALVLQDARQEGYLPPFPEDQGRDESDLYRALEQISVMMRRKDGRIDMPDLFRVAARLLKKGGTAPV